MKKILIFGGTNFIGRNLVERLLNIEEYEITLFNRQQTHSKLFPTVSKIKGDRETDDIKQIETTKWNYVIDLSCYFPDSLKNALDSLNNLDKYIFISTCSVYDNENNLTLLRNEESKILSCNSDQKTDRTTESYGNRKAECERILNDSGLSFAILRPALVFGKYDPTDRFYYWLYQIKRMNILLLPENGERIFSTTYVSDLVETIIQSLEQNSSSGVYNVITNPKTSISQLVAHARQVLKSDFSIINSSAEFLKKNNVAQWIDMPLWINGDHFTYSNKKFTEELGIKTTDFKKAIENTIHYFDNLNWPEPNYGMTEIIRQKLIIKAKTIANKTYLK